MPKPHHFLPLLASLSLFACGDPDDAETDSTSGAETQEPNPSESESGGGETWIPEDCSDNPFNSPCREALVAACRTIGDEGTCKAQETVLFESGHEVRCAWTERVQIVDPETCEVADPTWTCEAVMYPGALACVDPCDAEFPGLWDAFIVVEGAMMRRPCDNVRGEMHGLFTDTEGTCGNNISPPAPPICDCVPAVCDARPN